MHAVGLIVEYNPFHNGHAYHLMAAKEKAQADVVVAVMSGNFLQRGEPALVSKWYRTKMALLGGVDIVLELPYRFSTQQAEVFANGAVSILDAVGCDTLCFGSESGDIDSFVKTWEFLEGRQEYEEQIRQYIKTGISYPKALQLSFEHLDQTGDLVDLTKPNNILGFQYIKTIKAQKSSMKAITVKRMHADYHDEVFTSETIASATSIRKALFSGNEAFKSIERYVPVHTRELLHEYYDRFGLFHQWENYWPCLKFRLLQVDPTELREIYEVEEGLENRLIRMSLEAHTFQEFIQKVKTKRYTLTRLQRICTHILTNTRKSEMSQVQQKATYLRLLGMTENGRTYLNKAKANMSLPLISRLRAYQQTDIRPDIRAARIYSAILPYSGNKNLFYEEYRQPPIYLKQPR